MEKERLHYIDFMKGLCIMFVAMVHLDDHMFAVMGSNLDHTLQCFRIPMYYFISGIFFKTYDSASDFTRKKINNIFIPMVFFFTLAYIYKYIFHLLFPGIHYYGEYTDRFLIEPFVQREWYCNVPLWFLLSLLETNLIFYLINRIIKNDWLQIIVVLALGAAGWWMSTTHVRLPMFPDTALVGLPYFAFGTFMRKRGVLNKSKYDKWGPLVLLIVLTGFYFIAPEINILQQHLPNYFLLYTLPPVAISALLWASKNIKYCPIICYLGRYSLIVLGTHVIMIAPILITLQVYIFKSNDVWISFLAYGILMTLELGVVWIFKRLFPRFTAQKEFFKKGWKLT